MRQPNNRRDEKNKRHGRNIATNTDICRKTTTTTKTRYRILLEGKMIKTKHSQNLTRYTSNCTVINTICKI